MKRKRILLVDNIEYDAKELRNALVTSGYEVRAVQKQQEIQAELDSFAPDLVIVETRVPQLNMADIIKAIRARQGKRTIPVIATGNPRTVDERVAILDLDVDDYIYKPFELDEALARIENLFKESASIKQKTPPISRGFNGTLAEMTLVDLLQTLEVGKKNGIIHLQRAGNEGQVFVTEGEVVDAHLGELEPRAALLRMFTWTEGHFAVDMRKHNTPVQLNVSTKELISEGMTRLYRWEQLTSQLPPLHSVVHEAPEPAATTRTRDEEQVFRLLNGRKRFIDIIEESTFDDLKALRLLKALFEKGHVIEAPNQAGYMSDDQLEKYSQGNGDNGSARTDMLASAFSGLFREPSPEQIPGFNRRRYDRRRSDRRRQDRRRSDTDKQNRIWLNKTELIMIREKLSGRK